MTPRWNQSAAVNTRDGLELSEAPSIEKGKDDDWKGCAGRFHGRDPTHLLVDPFLVVLPDDIPQLGDEVFALLARQVRFGEVRLGQQAVDELLSAICGLGHVCARAAPRCLRLYACAWACQPAGRAAPHRRSRTQPPT